MIEFLRACLVMPIVAWWRLCERIAAYREWRARQEMGERWLMDRARGRELD